MASIKLRVRKKLQREYLQLRSEPLHWFLLKLGVCDLTLKPFQGLAIASVLFFGLLSSLVFPHQHEQYSLAPVPLEASIIVPTYKENENIPALCHRIFEAISQMNVIAELILVDDNSKDGTVETVQELQKTYNISLVVRTAERGLSSAVIHGFNVAKYPVLVVMDADLSHPPERLPSILAPLFAGEADFVVASRYVAGGGTKNWPVVRQVISWGATLLAWPVTGIHDPMSGFFALKKSVFLKGTHTLNTRGFKIGLELLVKCRPSHVVEVPFVFIDRTAGNSKLKLSTQVEYVRQLVGLYVHSHPHMALGLGLGLLTLVAARLSVLIH